MEYLPPEMLGQQEKEQIQSGVKDYVTGLKQAYDLNGLSEKLAESAGIYEKANKAGDMLFGNSRENTGVRIGEFAKVGRSRFKNTGELTEAIEKYQHNLSLLKADLHEKRGQVVDKLTEETIELQEKLIGKGISRIIF